MKKNYINKVSEPEQCSKDRRSGKEIVVNNVSNGYNNYNIDISI